MEKEILVTKMVKVDSDSVMEISLQALNLMREKAIHKAYFAQGSDNLLVTYRKEKEKTGNIVSVIESWGKVEWTDESQLVTLNADDLTRKANDELGNIEEEFELEVEW